MFPFFSGFRSRLAGLFSGSPKREPVATDAGAKEGSGPKFAFICLNPGPDPTPDLLKEKLSKWLNLGSADLLENFETTVDERITAISFNLHGNSVVAVRAGFPIPKDDMEYACANAFLWPEASEVLAKHDSHFIVTAFGEFDSPVEQGLFLSRVMAALTECYDTAAIYWGHATMVHRPEFFREVIEIAHDSNLPVIGWVGLLRARGKRPGSFDLYTRGLEVFGLMEIEVIGTTRLPSEVLGRVADLSHYLLMRGNVIQDGHTIGGDENEKIRVRHAKSAIGRPGKVLRIEL